MNESKSSPKSSTDSSEPKYPQAKQYTPPEKREAGKDLSVHFDTNKEAGAVVCTYKFSGFKYFGVHHLYVDRNDGETKIGKGFALAYHKEWVINLIQALIVGANEAFGLSLALTNLQDDTQVEE